MQGIKNILHTKDDKDDFHGGNEVTATTTVLGMLNGMLCVNAIVLPTLGISAGWATTIWCCFLIGYLLYYTAYLIITHMGKSRNMKYSILAHFDNDYRYMSAYGAIIWVSFIPFVFFFFNVVCQQIEGLIGFKSYWVAPCVAIVLIITTIVCRILHFAEQTMAVGIIGGVIFIIFLTWAFITSPSGPHTVPAFGSPFSLAAALVNALEIHDFLAQNIIKNPRKNEYQCVVTSTFFIGTLIYLFSTFGSFAIVNRTAYVPNPQIISDYFAPGMWQLTILQISLIIVPFTILPNYLIVSKVRFFQIFKIDLGSKIVASEIIYIILMFGAATIVFISGVNFQLIIIVNGAVIGYLYVILIPIFIHFKCVWFAKHSGTIEGDQEWNKKITPNHCQCDNHYKSKFRLYVQTVFLICILLAGLMLIYMTLTNLPSTTPQATTTNHLHPVASVGPVK